MRSRHLARVLIAIVALTSAVGATTYAFRHRVTVGVQDDGRSIVPNDLTS